MKFSEKIQQIKNEQLLKQCFYEIALMGIDPINFVDWYVEEGILKEGMFDQFAQGYNQSASQPSPLSGAANMMGKVAGKTANWAGNMAGKIQPGSFMKDFSNGVDPESFEKYTKQAVDALDYLSKRIGKSAALKNKINDENFQTSLISLINSMKNQPSPLQTRPTTLPKTQQSPYQTLSNQNTTQQPSPNKNDYVKEGEALALLQRRDPHITKDELNDVVKNKKLNRWKNDKTGEKFFLKSDILNFNVAYFNQDSFYTPFHVNDSNSFNDYLCNLNETREMNQMFLKLSEKGIDPFALTNWYLNEGCLNEGMWDDVKDWGKNQWNNISTGWNNWRQSSNDRNDVSAVKNALSSMKNLHDYVKANKLYPSFMIFLNSIYDKLQNTNLN